MLLIQDYLSTVESLCVSKNEHHNFAELFIEAIISPEQTMSAPSVRPAARRLGGVAVRAALLWGVKPCHTYRHASHGGHGLLLWWDTVEFQGTGRHQPRVFASMQRYHGGDWRNERGSKWSEGNRWWAVALPVAAALVVGAGRARGQVSHADAVVPKEDGARAEVRQTLDFLQT